MLSETKNNLVPLSQPLGVGQWDSAPKGRDIEEAGLGTTDLKALARKRLLRDSERDNNGTGNPKSCPTEEIAVGQKTGTVGRGDFEERAAIIEHDAGIPRAWAEAFARVCLMERPGGFSKAGWQHVVDNIGHMLDDKAVLQKLVKEGWSIEDVFGCHPVAPEINQSRKGLLILLGESDEIVSITDKAIGTRRKGAGNTLYYRRPLNPSPGKAMIWELQQKQ